MIITLRQDASPDQILTIEQKLTSLGLKLVDVTSQSGRYFVIARMPNLDIRSLADLKGVDDVHIVSDTYKLVSRKWKLNPSSIPAGLASDVTPIGGGGMSIMAGPCSVESEDQLVQIADFLVSQGVQFMRGGVFKPRSSPYAFRGLGIEGLAMMASVCRPRGIKIVTEVMQVSQIDPMLAYVDVFQVGARNTQNFNLLDALGQVSTPVLLKRGISGTIDELLQSAEYIFSGGNERIIFCERGIRTYETASRNTLDLNAVPILKDKSHLPVIIDPSHGIGIRQFVTPMALAGLMAGADGVILEVHPEPEKAASDGAQTLSFAEAEICFGKMRQTHELLKSWQ